MNRKHHNFPPPPVPRTVRELLKDYPELIEDLQDGLTRTHFGSGSPMHFDSAIWLLQDMLDGRGSKAHREEDQARARGDLEAASLAKKKAMAIAMARHEVYGDGDLWDYFKTYGKYFR